jgi:hypothetical protein
MKTHIRHKYKFTLELVPPGCHRRNAAEVAIPNFKAHFFSVLAGTADHSHPVFGIGYSHKPKLPSTSCANRIPHRQCLHMNIFVAHSTTIKCISHQWVARSKSTKNGQTRHMGFPQHRPLVPLLNAAAFRTLKCSLTTTALLGFSFKCSP